MEFKKKLLFFAPLLIWMGIIFSFSSRQRISVSEQYIFNFLFFKTLHIIEYAILYLLAFRAFFYGASQSKKNALRYALYVTFLYAVSDEIHQTLIPTRQGAFRDVIIDSLGASIAWIFLKYIEPKTPKKLRKLVTHWQLY